jgi:DNA-binding transcriptional LysR family regulator
MGLNWDDFRYLLAVARNGGVAAAAASLGVNHATVYRRIDQLEAALGARLLERGGRSLTLTVAGEEFLAGAEAMDTAALAVQARLAGRDLEPVGILRLTAPDDITDKILLPLLVEFRELYPRIVIELATANRFLNISRREADIALRATADPPPALIGRKATGLATAVYAHASFAGQPLEALPWLDWEEGLGPTALQAWMRENVRPDQILLRINSMRSLAAGVAAGLGAAVLPCFLGDEAPELVRLKDPLPGWRTDLWILTHPDLRGVTRVRLLTAFLFEKIRRKRDLFEGRRGRRTSSPPSATPA